MLLTFNPVFLKVRPSRVDGKRMALPSDSAQIPQFRQKLEEALVDPEPMCLAIIRVGESPDATVDADDDEVDLEPVTDDEIMAAIQARLSYQLRRYDLMARAEEDRFMLVVKTLADTRVLDARMYQLYGAIAEPYMIGGRAITVPISLGAAVRLPAESAAALMQRADKALSTADAAGGKAPVLI